MDIPEAEIITEGKSKNTHENALFSKKIMDEKCIKGKAILITSGFHMKRAMGCFKKAGIEVIPYSTDRYSSKIRRFQFDYLLLPNSGTLLNWDVLMHEIVGYVTYYFSGYL